MSAAIMDLLEFDESSPMRSAGPLPVDVDSRSELLRVVPPMRATEPILSAENHSLVAQVLREQRNHDTLTEAGLQAVRTVLFTGPPGLGKTMCAKWIASELGLPLLVLDLSTVMSSLLGKTGNNLRAVIEFAKGEHGILFLDEFDAVAKRRDDAVEVGELKRLVTVLLQEIDSWPPGSLLIAATNHEDLLDPAVWRRFDVQLRFEQPDFGSLREAAERFLSFHQDGKELSVAVASAFAGKSYSDVEREINRLRKESLLTDTDVSDLLATTVRSVCKNLKPKDRTAIAVTMRHHGVTQSKAHEWTGVARDTIRKAMQVER